MVEDSRLRSHLYAVIGHVLWHLAPFRERFVGAPNQEWRHLHYSERCLYCAMHGMFKQCHATYQAGLFQKDCGALTKVNSSDLRAALSRDEHRHIDNDISLFFEVLWRYHAAQSTVAGPVRLPQACCVSHAVFHSPLVVVGSVCGCTRALRNEFKLLQPLMVAPEHSERLSSSKSASEEHHREMNLRPQDAEIGGACNEEMPFGIQVSVADLMRLCEQVGEEEMMEEGLTPLFPRLLRQCWVLAAGECPESVEDCQPVLALKHRPPVLALHLQVRC